MWPGWLRWPAAAGMPSRGALKEMETAGYLTRMRAHGEGGKFTGVVYTIRDVAGTIVGKPDNG